MTKRPPSLFSSLLQPNNHHTHMHMHGVDTTTTWFLLSLLLILLVSSIPCLVAGQNETTSDGSGTQPPPPDDENNNIYNNNYEEGGKLNPNMAIIMVVLVSAFFIMGFFSVYVRQCAERRFMGGGGGGGGSSLEATAGPGPFAFGRGGRGGLDIAVIHTFPTFIYSSVKALKIGKGSLECAVCLTDFQDDHLLRLLPKCSHVFHHDCVDTWLFSHNTCPVCRANLVPEPGETIEPPISQPEPNPAPTHGEPSPDQVCVSIENNITVSPLTTEQNNPPPANKSKPPRSRSTGMRFTRLFARSHSTGHSLVQAGEDQERFTLRLPDDVRNRLIIDAQLNRTKSCSIVAFPRARSIRTGYRRSRSGGGGRNYERFDKEDRTSPWGFSMTPPFISRTGSGRSPLPRGRAGSDQAPATRSCFKSDKPSQFDRIFLGLDIENGERSTDSLRPHSPL